MRISIIVPCYNEEEGILPFYREATNAFSKKNVEFEFIFVDDGSRDNTRSVLKEISLKNGKVSVLSFTRNFGKDAAIFAGMKRATGDLIAVIDVDLQQNPCYLLEMMQILLSEPQTDCVIAYQERRKESCFRKLFKRLFYLFMKLFSDVSIFPDSGDFCMMRRNVAEAVLSLPEHRRFFKGILAWLGFPTKYIPYTVSERKTGKSKWSFSSLFSYAVHGILSFGVQPLRISFFASGLFLLLGIAIFFACLILKIDIFFSLVLLFLFFSFSLIALLLGIIGEYMGMAFFETTRRPLYVIREETNPDRRD